MHRFLGIALILLFGCLAAGDDILAIQDGKLITVQAIVDPKVNINGIGPELVVGEMAIASASLIQDPAAGFVKSSRYVWRVELNGKEQAFLEGTNNKIGFVAKGGRLVVTCSGTITYVVAEKTIEKETKAAAVIDLGKPPEPIPPTPTPKPDPKVPNGHLGFTKLSYDSFFPLIQDTTKKALLAKSMENVYRGIASKVGAGGYSDTDGNKWIASVFGDLKGLLNKAIEDVGVARNDVLPFATTLSDKLYVEYNNDKLKTTDEWRDVLNAIADGLTYIK